MTLCKGMSYKSRLVTFGTIEKISGVINPRGFFQLLENDPIDNDAVTIHKTLYRAEEF